MRVTEAQNYFELRNSIAFEYIEFFEKLGYLIILIPNNSKNIKKYFKDTDIEMLVLSGGNNVSPSLYDSKTNLNDVYLQRDKCEFELIKYSLKKDIPILGICKGFHLLNVFFKGTIKEKVSDHVNLQHSLDSKIDFLSNKLTNSFHNQAICEKELSSDLVSLAKTDDGIIELYKHKSKKVMGIQWHPERQNKKFDKKLIKKLIKGKL